MHIFDIRKAGRKDISTVARMMVALWPHHAISEMEAEVEAFLRQEEGVIFLAEDRGFAQCQLRYDYVEGTESSPVGYLEGIYVAEDCRHQGLARALVRSCENWVKEKGCVEFASDCELTNSQSLKFHVSVGFEEANRIICFTKKL